LDFDRFFKNPQISNFMKIHPVVPSGQTDTIKVTVASPNFANMVKMNVLVFR
jgi:hypothetical protein